MPIYQNALTQQPTNRLAYEDRIGATPRNEYLGALADFLAQSYAPQRTQQMQGVAQFLSLPAVSQTLDRLSYGEPLTTGAGMTTRVRPEALEAAMAVAPAAKPVTMASLQAARLARQAALATKGLPVGMSTEAVGGMGFLRPQAPQEEALRLAQQRAALPTSRGGLGLPANNTAQQRLAAMEFNTPAYHTSRTGVDTNILDSGKYAMAPFDAIGTHFGTKEAALDRFNRTVGTTDQIKGSSYPVLLRGDKPYMDASGNIYTEDPLATMLSAKSDYGNLQKSNANLRNEIFADNSIIPYVNDVEAAGSISYIAPPENIRSIFAAGDPWRKTAATAAAFGVAAPDLLAAESRDDINQMRKLKANKK